VGCVRDIASGDQPSEIALGDLLVLHVSRGPLARWCPGCNPVAKYTGPRTSADRRGSADLRSWFVGDAAVMVR